MADLYKTNDGKTFTNKDEAQKHANNLASNQAELFAAGSRNEAGVRGRYLRVMQAYNAQNWDAIIANEEIDYSEDFGSIVVNNLFAESPPPLKIMRAVAYGKKGDWEKAYNDIFHYGDPSKNKYNQLPAALSIAKQAWEKAHGRAMTDKDYNNIFTAYRIKSCEKEIAWRMRSINTERYEELRAKYYNEIGECIKEWEQLTGKKYTGPRPPAELYPAKKKKSKLGLVILIIIVGLLVLFNAPLIIGSLSSQNSSSSAAPTVTVTADSLNLRAEVSGSAEIIKALNQGSVLTVTGEAVNGWLPVEHEGAKGWVSSQYVE